MYSSSSLNKVAKWKISAWSKNIANWNQINSVNLKWRMDRLNTTALYNRVKLLVSKENWIEFKEIEILIRKENWLKVNKSLKKKVMLCK